MDLINYPFTSQISCLKFLSEPEDIQQYFVVGSGLEPNNSLTLMTMGGDLNEPTVISKIQHSGDVMDIKYNKAHDRILTSSSNGSLNIFQSESDGENIRLELDVGWDKLCSSAISGCLFSDNRIVAVSEDGSILGIRLDSAAKDPKDLFEFKVKECSSITAIEHIDQNSFLTSNGFGQINLWDTRNHCSPQWSNLRIGSMAPMHCLSRHPTQPNIVVSGSSGCICLWDLRNSDKNGPVQLNIGPEDNDVWKIRFHPTSPQNLFITTSSSGLINVCGRSSVFDWADYNSCLATLQMNPLIGNKSITSLDVSESLVICGSDDEILCLVPIHL